MAWWLLGKETKTQPKKKGRGHATAKKRGFEPTWDPKRTMAGLNLLGVAVLTLGLLVGWRAAEAGLRGYITRELTAPVAPEQVDLADAPPWTPSWLQEQFHRLISSEVSGDPLDKNSLIRAAERLADSAWVEKVDRVQRMPDGRILVQAVYRRPMALVRTEHGYYLVTREAIRLPGLYVESQLPELGLPVIAGVTARPFEEGEVWPGESIQAGLALVGYLANEPYFSQIQAFDVSQRDRRGRLHLRLQVRHGGEVVWGLPPGSERALEPEPEVKRERLRKIYQKKGAIDAGSPLVLISGPEVWYQWENSGDPASPADYTMRH